MTKTSAWKNKRHTARVERKAEKRAQQKSRRGRTPRRPIMQDFQPKVRPGLVSNFGSLAQKLIGGKKK